MAGLAYFASDLSRLEQAEAEAICGVEADRANEFLDLRFTGPMMNREHGNLLAYARGMLTWRRRHKYCGVCGSETRPKDGGHLRVCSDADCATSHFPRTDPAVIMLVTHGDKCLLGRQKTWPPGMHSTLAGFVEPGETLEMAVAREVFEESGVRVHDVALSLLPALAVPDVAHARLSRQSACPTNSTSIPTRSNRRPGSSATGWSNRSAGAARISSCRAGIPSPGSCAKTGWPAGPGERHERFSRPNCRPC